MSDYEETKKWLEELGLIDQPVKYPIKEPMDDGSIHCINPNCYSQKEYAENFGEEYAKQYPLFRSFWRDGQYWLRCVQCDAEFRTSKTLNGVHLNGGKRIEADL